MILGFTFYSTPTGLGIVLAENLSTNIEHLRCSENVFNLENKPIGDYQSLCVSAREYIFFSPAETLSSLRKTDSPTIKVGDYQFLFCIEQRAKNQSGKSLT